MNANPSFDTLEGILKWALVGIGGLLVFMSLIAFASVFFPFPPGSFLEFLIGIYFAAINPLTMKIVSATAIDVWIARALSFTFLFTLPTYLLAGWLVKFLRPISLLSRKGRFLIVLFFWVICVSMSFLSKSVYFSQEGRPQKKYHRHSDCSIEFFPIEMDYHPIYGKQLKIITTEVVEESESRKAGYLTVRVTTIPSDAEIYFNWKYEARTPAIIKKENLSGNWVITKEGYMPEIREQLDCRGGDSFMIPLRPLTKGDQKKILIGFEDGQGDADALHLLNDELRTRKLLIAHQENMADFLKSLNEAGGPTNKALLAWVRAKFAADILLIIKLKQHSSELGQADVGYREIQESLKGVYSSQTIADTKIIDTHSGEVLSSFSTMAHGTSLDKQSSRSQSLSKTLYQVAEKIRKEIGNP